MVTIFESSPPSPKKAEEKTPPRPFVAASPPPPPPAEPPKPSEPPSPYAQKLTPAVFKLAQEYQKYYLKLQSGIKQAVIHVDEIASRVALLYEKIRKIVDWKEEHLVRRAAIERILKRNILSEISGLKIKPEQIAESLVLELIRGGHLPNDEIPQSRVAQVQKILEKYTYLLENNPLNHRQELSPKAKKKFNFSTWVQEIAACEIEETLMPPQRENALLKAMIELIGERIQITPPDCLSQEDKDTQIFIAVHRTLFHLDDPIITYRLLKRRFPEWENPSPAFLAELAQKIFTLQKQLNHQLNHPHASKFFAVCEKYDTAYLILGDVLDTFKSKPKKIFPVIAKQAKIKPLIKKAYEKRLSTLKSRLYRAAIYSTLSIFVAGGLSLFIFEVPLAKLIYGEWSPLAMFVDILLPTVLMYFLVSIVKPPGKNNQERVIQEINKISYPSEEKDIYEIRPLKKHGRVIEAVLGLLYLSGTALSLSFIFWVFQVAQVPLTSLYIDTLNVAMVVSAAMVIKQRSKELTIEEKASFWEFSLDILFVPLGKIGQWLADKWKEYNVVSIFFTALLDMPFATFVSFIESWRGFIKEKKAEIH